MMKINSDGLFKKKKESRGFKLKGSFNIDFVVCGGNGKTYKLAICFIIYLYSHLGHNTHL